MSKYIKLNDAISKIVNTPTRVITNNLTALADRQHEIIDMLADLPTIEIVRCKDCRWHKEFDGCLFSTAECEPEHFCSWGERKDNE